MPFGGGKGGIQLDSRHYGREELESITLRYMYKLKNLIGPNVDIPAPDIGTNGDIMAIMLRQYIDGERERHAQRGIVTGKDVRIGGTVSYYEWIHNKRMESWTEAEVNRRLEVTMKRSWRIIRDIARNTPRMSQLHDSRKYCVGREMSMRSAAMVLALTRIEAHYLLEGFSQ